MYGMSFILAYQHAQQHTLDRAMKKLIIIVLALGAVVAYSAVPPPAEVEKVLEGKIIQDDFVNEEEPVDVPLRYRDSLKEYGYFIREQGCTTNEFVQALMLAATNGAYSLEWTEDQKDTIAARALIALRTMDRPDATNFVRIVNADGRTHFRYVDFTAPFIHTNLEPEVLDYMRTQCVRTNLYEDLAFSVMSDMLETLSTMPPELQPAATNRVAQYIYFTIGHIADEQNFQDKELIKLIPSYSNSLQRLSLMRYVAATATNTYERAYAQRAVQALSAAPTNTLNNIPWIAQ